MHGFVDRLAQWNTAQSAGETFLVVSIRRNIEPSSTL